MANCLNQPRASLHQLHKSFFKFHSIEHTCAFYLPLPSGIQLYMFEAAWSIHSSLKFLLLKYSVSFEHFLLLLAFEFTNLFFLWCPVCVNPSTMSFNLTHCNFPTKKFNLVFFLKVSFKNLNLYFKIYGIGAGEMAQEAKSACCSYRRLGGWFLATTLSGS